LKVYSSNFDKFYTKPEIAKYCLSVFFKTVKKHNFVFIEPSAGNGSFFNILPDKKIGIDIEPECDNIIKADYLQWTPPIFFNKKIVVIGNFPFGIRGTLQIKFVNHSEFADYLAFIGSPLFLKEHHRPKKFKIIHKEVLPKNSFLFNGKDYSIETYFYIMEKTNQNKERKEVIKSNLINCWVCGYSAKYKVALDKLHLADFFLPSAIWATKSFNIYSSLEEVPSHWGYAIQVVDKQNLEKIKNIFKTTNWDTYFQLEKRTKNLNKNLIERILIENFTPAV